MIQLFLIFIALFLAELFYFRIADRFNIIDKPNERSSHTQITIRGGGIIFPIAWILYSVMHGFAFPFLTTGLVLIATISFLDDRMELSSRIRLLVHLLAFTLCFMELQLFSILPWWAIPILYIVSIGCVNAINFMDGINGMTGMYSMGVLLPIYYLISPTSFDLNGTVYLIVAIAVFGFFNFRKIAKCFAGDVGSVGIGYLLIFLLLGLMSHYWQDGNGMNPSKEFRQYTGFELKYILFLTLYGVDAILTIVHRLILKENIFKAHRKHLYQYLANEMKCPHLWVAFGYALVQLSINIWVVQSKVTFMTGLGLLVLLCLLYIFCKKMILSRTPKA
jgi:UDP-GlcNAc:undecaprenyl-phosphate GlcNAc-1-phosphate transferase